MSHPHECPFCHAPLNLCRCWPESRRPLPSKEVDPPSSPDSSIYDDYVIKVMNDTGEVIIRNSEEELLRRLNTQDHSYVLIALEIVRLRKRVAELERTEKP